MCTPFTCCEANTTTLTKPLITPHNPITGRARAVVTHAAGVLPPGLGPRHGAPLLHAGGTQAERERRVGRALARRRQATVIFRPQRPMHREMLCAHREAPRSPRRCIPHPFLWSPTLLAQRVGRALLELTAARPAPRCRRRGCVLLRATTALAPSLSSGPRFCLQGSSLARLLTFSATAPVPQAERPREPAGRRGRDPTPPARCCKSHFYLGTAPLNDDATTLLA